MWLLQRGMRGLIYPALAAATEYSGRALRGEGFLDFWEREYKCKAEPAGDIPRSSSLTCRLLGHGECHGGWLGGHIQGKNEIFCCQTAALGRRGEMSKVLGWDLMPSTLGAAPQP